MLIAEHVRTYAWPAAIRGMRNPFNSWDKSDSTRLWDEVPTMGENDMGLMRKLVKAGPDHAKFLRMIGISMDIIAPSYWWPEFDSYKVGVVRNSCSKMHTLLARPFELTDFSVEALDEDLEDFDKLIEKLNKKRDTYLECKDEEERKRIWKSILVQLPLSFFQRATVIFNYEVARRMYHARKNHKLDEWHELCKVLEGLPFAEELIVGTEERNNGDNNEN